MRQRPALITNLANFDLSDPGTGDVLSYGIGRLASTQTDKALKAYISYKNAGHLDIVQQQNAFKTLAKELAKSGKSAESLEFANQNTELVDEEMVDQLLKENLKRQDWLSVHRWIMLLDRESRQKDKWRYWRARAQLKIATGTESSASAIGKELMEQLALERSYYGHMASLFTDSPYALMDKHEPAEPGVLDRIESLDSVQQAVELDAVGYFLNSRQAWSHALTLLDEPEQIAAGQVGLRNQLYYSAIVAMAKASFWEDLSVRFPIPHRPVFERWANQEQISMPWMLAISRQESSFAADIRSSAGARGLMQVMPATAREIARNKGITYSRKRLSDPAYNIQLGANYLRQGIDRLSGNMIFSTAAYNAGIHRASRWLKDDKDQLPLDIWIEIIPFSETRKYVKNVMAFSVIYADKLGQESPLEAHRDVLFEGPGA